MSRLLQRREWLLLAGGLAAGPLRAQTPGQPPLQIAVAPFLTPSAMLAAFRPLREHLQQRLQRPVEFYTARDFVDLLEQSRRGAFDISLLPAHLAGLAIQDWRFLPLAATISATKVLVLVRNDQRILSAADLRGRSVGALGQLSLSAASGALWLRQQKLEPGRDVSILPQSSINSALLNLQHGDVDAVFATRTQLDLLTPGQFNAFISLAELADIPAPIYVARPGTPVPQLQRWRAALHGFRPDANSPVTVVNSRLHEPSPAELKRLAALRDMAREQMQASGLR